jgi:AcrR family transcriptional regulator
MELARSSSASPKRERRADAEKNRSAILEHAYQVLTSGDEWSLNSIAKGAGVGNATLYRHFANRDELVLAVYELEVDRVANSAEQLLTELPPMQALEAWVGELARYAMTKHGFAEALQAVTAPGTETFADTYDRIVMSLALLLKAASDAGELRADLDPDDVLLALAGLWQLDPNSDWEGRAKRLFKVVLTGIRP